MKTRLCIVLSAVFFLTMLGTNAPAAAAGQSADSTELKAKENRTKQLRHGYFKHDGNKVYYYW